MPRAKSYVLNDVAYDALAQFWSTGYNATSIDDLVRVTGVSRHALYGEFLSKRGLYLNCFARYRETIVDPAIALIEAPGATIDAISAYFDLQITRAEAAGLPGPGCFVANAASETAPHDVDVRGLVVAHNERLRAGFAHVLRQSMTTPNEDMCDRLGQALVVFANGLWTMSRVTDSADALRQISATFLQAVEREIGYVRNEHT